MNRHKLDPDVVREIREGRARAMDWLSNQFREVLPNNHPYSLRSIAKRLGVSPATVQRITSGQTYRFA